MLYSAMRRLPAFGGPGVQARGGFVPMSLSLAPGSVEGEHATTDATTHAASAIEEGGGASANAWDRGANEHVAGQRPPASRTIFKCRKT